MSDLREAIEASMNDIGLGWEERLDRSEERIRAAILANIDPARSFTASMLAAIAADDPWAAGFRAGWQAAREAALR